MRGNIAIFIPHDGCPQQCSFCNQHTISGASHTPSGDEVKSICKEATDKALLSGKKLEIAFFGGSFTAISRCLMISLLECVQEFLSLECVIGIRISTRPDCIDSEILGILKRYGVTSIELGAQSMCDEVLDKNKRGHTVKDVYVASEMIKQAGFSLGLQMMTGLYGATSQNDYETALEFIKIHPDTVRVYPTVVLKGTELAELVASGEYAPPDVEHSIPFVCRIVKLFNDNNIEILRLGLHGSENVESEMVAGCYHPAFGEMCLGYSFFKQIEQEIAEKNLYGKKDCLELVVYYKKSSQVLGQKRKNIEALHQLGYSVKVIVSQDELPDGRAFVIR